MGIALSHRRADGARRHGAAVVRRLAAGDAAGRAARSRLADAAAGADIGEKIIERCTHGQSSPASASRPTAARCRSCRPKSKSIRDCGNLIRRAQLAAAGEPRSSGGGETALPTATPLSPSDSARSARCIDRRRAAVSSAAARQPGRRASQRLLGVQLAPRLTAGRARVPARLRARARRAARSEGASVAAAPTEHAGPPPAPSAPPTRSGVAVDLRGRCSIAPWRRSQRRAAPARAAGRRGCSAGGRRR